MGVYVTVEKRQRLSKVDVISKCRKARKSVVGAWEFSSRQDVRIVIELREEGVSGASPGRLRDLGDDEDPLRGGVNRKV